MHLLAQLNADEAQVVIRSSQEYSDLSLTVYASALDWLIELGLAEPTKAGAELAAGVARLSPSARALLLFERGLGHQNPAWLANADVVVGDEDELPADAAALAAATDVDEPSATLAVRRVHGRMDLQRRTEVGAAGEKALVAALEKAWPSSVDHIALRHDGFGYDVAIVVDDEEWHLEVKSTTRRGRLVLHLSRHEFEVGRLDPRWQLVVVGLDELSCLSAVATVDPARVRERAPVDRAGNGRWTAARFELPREALARGLPFLPLVGIESGVGPVLRGEVETALEFAWWPDAIQPAAIPSRSSNTS